jgi:hypothetical protein
MHQRARSPSRRPIFLHSIDLDIELWNPYDDAVLDDGMTQIVDFDVIEIDGCRIDQLMQGTFGGRDCLPLEAAPSADDFVGPAEILATGDAGKYVITHSYVVPRMLAADAKSTLLDYSARLYYAEREQQLDPTLKLPTFKPNDLEVRQFAFGDKSQGTPCWVDGFVVPRDRLELKRAAIVAVLIYMQSPEAYLAFAEPTPGLAPSYLLPATVSAYEDTALLEKQPLLLKYRAALDGSFPVLDSETWQGMRAAGTTLRTLLNP